MLSSLIGSKNNASMMLLKIQTSASYDEQLAVYNLLKQKQLSYFPYEPLGEKWLILERDPGVDIGARLNHLPAVERLLRVDTPYPLVSRAYRADNTIVHVQGVAIGGERIVLMAGPCAIESEEQIASISHAVQRAGVSILRGSAYKPRSSPYSFQGMGREGVWLHKAAQKRHGMPTLTEVTNVHDVAFVAEHVDLLQIGARNMQNYDLLKAVGQSGHPVILKRGLSATLEEWLLSAEYLMVHGNPNIILCERGIRTYETVTRSTLDLSSIAIIKQWSHLPVIVDPSHAAGRVDVIPALSKAALAAGADGLLIEVHHDPAHAKCDGKQALLPEELERLVCDLKRIASAVGRCL